MTISRVKPANWAANELLMSAQINALDANVTNALDKRSSQTDTLGSIVQCQAPGRIIQSVVACPNSNFTTSMTTAQLYVASSASASTSTLTWTISTFLGTPLAGDEVVFQADNTFLASQSGTASVTNGSSAITFSVAQTLAAGTAIQFASQPGVWYYLLNAISGTTAGVLTGNYTGSTNAATTSQTAAVANIVSSDVPGTTLYQLGLSPLADGAYATFEFNGSTWKLQSNTGPRLRMQQFTSNGTFNVPIGVSQVLMLLCGGGGGGGGGASGTTAALGYSNGGGGGGGAPLVTGWCAVSSGGTASVVVGQGGTGGAAGANGNNGTASSFTGVTAIQASGGGGGVAGAYVSSSLQYSPGGTSPFLTTLYPSTVVPTPLPGSGGPGGFAGGGGTNVIGYSGYPSATVSAVPAVAISGGAGGGYTITSGAAGGGGGSGAGLVGNIPGGAGGNGGAPGGTTGSAGSNGVAAAAGSGSGGGGGGGGGAGSASGGTGGTGGTGGSGCVIVIWVK